MQRHPEYTRERIAQLVGRLRELVHRDRRPVASLALAGPVDRIPYAAAQSLDYRPAALGDQLGPRWSTYWLRVRATVPSAFAGSRVDLIFHSFSEATLWVDGEVAQGLNGGDGERPDAVLVERASGGEDLAFSIEIACNAMFGVPGRRFQSIEPVVLDRCELARFDEEAWRLWLALRLLADLEAQADLEPTWRGRLLARLNDACNAFVEDDRSTWAAVAAIAAELLATRNGDVAHELTAIGHAHLDTAWLWPIAETHRKCARTFATQLAYLDRYPDYRFACSSAQHYAWIDEEHPALARRIRAAVADGRWLPVGGTWIEPDCNLPAGESLVRQFLYGQRYFERELGGRCREFWNPDVFGYNAQLPQIMRGAGIERFLTQKLSWSRFTKPQHHTFIWQGLDGSEVLAHFPPADTYNARADVATLRANVTKHKDHDRTRESLMLFGFGDGGSGPTPEMIESLLLAGDVQGLPRTAMRSADAFFERLEADLVDRPRVVGELYLEYHRGTYTSQAQAKRGNRRCEQLLHDVELVTALSGPPTAYPRAELETLWRTVLTNQFHDILPGSGITEVYRDCAADHAQVEARADELLVCALGRPGAGVEPLPFSTVGAARVQVVERPDGSLALASVPGIGAGTYVASDGHRVTAERVDSSYVLENEHLRVVVAADGSIASVVHRATGREALAGRGNVLELYDDRPVRWDAWDVDPFHLETRRECGPPRTIELESSELRAEVMVARSIGRDSHLTQRIRLDAAAPYVAFATEVDWHEAHTLLKVAFEVDIHAHDATYEMQFGVTRRPTHYSTAADLARYEVPGHRFADLSEHGFGVALLNDCKYGMSTYGQTMRLSLLRGSRHPDPYADIGRHVFAYALMPHAGGYADGGVVAAARAFGAPLHEVIGVDAGPLVDCDDPNLVIDTVKRAEDSDALVLRLYEAHGGRGSACVRVPGAARRARTANLLEDPGDDLTLSDGTIVVPYRPFEIVTLLVEA